MSDLSPAPTPTNEQQDARCRVLDVILSHASTNAAYPISPRDLDAGRARAGALADAVLAAVSAAAPDDHTCYSDECGEPCQSWQAMRRVEIEILKRENNKLARRLGEARAALAARPAPTHECEQEYGTDRDGCVVGPLPCRHPEHTRPAPVVSGADVDGLSVAIRTWHDATFPGKTNTAVALKMAEEAGEVAGAQTRCDEIADGHRTGEPTAAREHLAKELGDLAIVWLTLCARHDLAPETVVRDRWATIQNRRWTTAEPDAATPVGTKRPDARAGFEEMWDGDRWVPICLDCGDEAAYCDGTRHRTVTDTPALEVPCPKCGGLNGSHGTVYVGRGHIAPCPAADDEGGRE